jgi:peptidoglycan/LPS O-acetylase OafA/YrhL
MAKEFNPSVGSVDYPNLDFLRAVAVSFVYAFHLINNFGKPTLDLGRIGVLLFFFHTSLVLMMSLERLSFRKEPLFRSFYVRRFFRIYPLSIFCVLVIVGAQLPRAPWWPYAAPSLSTFAANVFLYMNLVYAPPVTSVLWSLPYEVQMYVVLPFLFLIGRRVQAPGIALLWLTSVIAGMTLPMVSGRLDLFSFGPCFMAGVLAYFAGYGSRSGPLPSWIWPISIITGSAVFFLADASGYGQFGGWGTCFIVAIASLCCRQLNLSVINRICSLVAKYSYGIYLTHLHAMWIAFVVLANAPLIAQWASLIALSIGLPFALYHFLEAPFVRLGAFCAHRLSRSRVAPIPATI